MVPSFAKCLNISLFTGCDFGDFVASLNKHMPYKCTMIVDFLYIQIVMNVMGVPLLFICKLCSRILLSIPMKNLYKIRSSGLDFYLMSNGF
jgi:hypothetical protein